MPPQCLVVIGAILAATIRVQQHLRLWLPACTGRLQRGMYQSLLHAVVHCPAENGARIEIEHDGQVKPALRSLHVGHVRNPVTIGAIRSELAIQVIRSNGEVVTTA